MFVATRIMQAGPGKALEAVANAMALVESLNSSHGSDFAVGVQVGGDPTAIGASSRFESLEAYQAFIDAAQADEALQAKMMAASENLVAGATEDTLWSIVRPPGEPQEFTTASSANVRTSQTAEALGFALEVAENATSVMGSEVGVVTAFTGDRSRLIWISNAASMAQIQANNDALMADATYVDGFKRSEGLFVESTLTSTIWRTVG